MQSENMLDYDINIMLHLTLGFNGRTGLEFDQSAHFFSTLMCNTTKGHLLIN